MTMILHFKSNKGRIVKKYFFDSMEHNSSKVRVSDIPHEGLSLVFELSREALHERINKVVHTSSDVSLSQPAMVFRVPLPVRAELHSDGQLIEMTGDLSADYTTLCARCGEEAVQNLSVPVSLIFKPRKDKSDFDDIGYVLYEGDVLDCAEALEELLVLSIPYAVYCSGTCKGLCPGCGSNLNVSDCGCRDLARGHDQEDEVSEESPFSKLKHLLS
jgi:uncharacterized protein